MCTKTNGDFGLRTFPQQVLALLCGLCLLTVPTSAVGSTDEPEKPDSRIAERDSLWQQAQQLVADGKSTEAIEVGEQVLKIEQTVFGDVHLELTGTLQWLSQQHLALQQMPQAVDYASQYESVTEQLHGKDHWQTVSARWQADYVRKQQAAPADTVKAMLSIEARYNELNAAGKYAEAAVELEKLVPYELDVLGAEHPNLAITWTLQADCWLNAEQYGKAEQAATKALDVRRKALGDMHPDTAQVTWYLAKALIFQQRHEEALAPLEQAASIWKATEQPVFAAWADSWRGDSLAALDRKPEAAKAYHAALTAFREQGHAEGEAIHLKHLADLDGSVDLKGERDRLWQAALAAGEERRLDDAALLGERVLAIEKVWLGDNNAEVIATLKWLAAVYEAANNRSAAIASLEAVVSRHAAIDGDSHYRTTDARLAVTYFRRFSDLTDAQRAELAETSDLIVQGSTAMRAGQFATALEKTLTAQQIFGRLLGEEHPFYALSLNRLGQLYLTMGDYARAEPLYLQCQQIQKKVLGEEHPDYANTLNNIALFYATKRDFARAEPLYLQCQQIQKKLLLEEHPDYATMLRNIAIFYQTVGDYARAEPLFLQCQQIQKKVLGEEHPDYATTLNSLALYYATKSDYARAEPLYLQCQQIQKKVLGEEHPDYALTLNNLAEFYITIGDYARAEPLHLQCKEIRKKVLGDEHPDYAATLNNLGQFYQTMGDYARAEPLFLQCQQIQKTMLGEEHPHYAHVLGNLSFLYRTMQQHSKAEAFAAESMSLARSLLDKSSIILSERQQLAMNQMLRYRLDSYLSLALDNPEFQAKAAREVLQWKGATLVRQRAMRLAAEEPGISERFVELQQVSRQLASLSRATPSGELDDWKKRITNLTTDKERLEAQLSRDSATFRSAMQQITPEQIQAAIPPDAVLIDFLQFSRSRPAEKKGQWDYTTSLLAVIVKHNGDPQLIELGAIAPLSVAIDTWRQTFGVSPQGKQAGLAIRQQIWKPLLKHIADAKTVLVSTDGVVGRLPLAALPGKEPGTYLIEDHHLAMIPVPQLLPALVNDLGNKALSRELLLLGDVDYDAEPAAPEESHRKKRRPGQSENRADLIDSAFRPLSGAAGEVAAIQVLYSDLFEADDDDVHTLKQTTATEAAFRDIAGEFRHLHLATHGFFAPPTVLSAMSPEAIDKAASSQQTFSETSASTLPPRITGIGAGLQVVDRGSVITQIVPGGPAAKDGQLQPTDIIVGVAEGEEEFVELAGLSLQQIVQLIRGREGSQVRLQVLSGGEGEPQVVAITRDVLPGTPVASRSDAASRGQLVSSDHSVTGWNPGLLSGLAMAGANLEPEPGKDDGILTSQEIAFLPLNGVDTVVLSACETGLGEVAGGEGLIGIQRAFQVSGARTTVASFWKVDDLVTRRLMERFYRNLWEKEMPRLDSLREAQLYILNNPESIRGAKADDQEATERVSPRYWAAFQLSGDWR